MPPGKWTALITVFFLTILVSVLTGSTSLITVPVMISFGIEPHAAIATNTLALTFVSVGGALLFARRNIITLNRLPALIALALLGSALGAAAMLRVPGTTLEILPARGSASPLFSIFDSRNGREVHAAASGMVSGLGYVVSFLLAIYGGFFSGG